MITTGKNHRDITLTRAIVKYDIVYDIVNYVINDIISDIVYDIVIWDSMRFRLRRHIQFYNFSNKYLLINIIKSVIEC